MELGTGQEPVKEGKPSGRVKGTDLSWELAHAIHRGLSINLNFPVLLMPVGHGSPTYFSSLMDDALKKRSAHAFHPFGNIG